MSTLQMRWPPADLDGGATPPWFCGGGGDCDECGFDWCNCD